MAARVLISLEDVSVKFGGKPLFEDINLHIAEGEKICLVGKNGAGKTTLMRLITGELETDSGKRFALPTLQVGYLAQTINHNPTQTVHDFVLGGLSSSENLEEKGYLADMMMEPLELTASATLGTLSGGQLRRAGLARGLMAEPDLLLLDEPTNHLDLSAIQWLEDYLASYRGAVLCVSHDRAFLNAISRKVFWIDRGLIRTCPKGYKEFDAWAEQIIEQEVRELQNLQKKVEAEVDWTQGGVTGRRKRNQRRMSELHRLREKLRNDKANYKQTKQTISLDPLLPSQASKMIAEFKGVGKTFTRDGKVTQILHDFHFRVMRGDKIGILGKNGSGKSTFLKMLVDQLEPDTGNIKRGKSIDFTYFDQNRVNLDPKKTLWQTLCPDGGDYVFLGNPENPRTQHVCGYLKNFLFDPKIARDYVGTLSGGQQNRLMLAKALAQPGNVLILDEPTNDLDMDTLDMLQEILLDYTGTLLLVSHDRDFLDRTVSSVLAFEGDAVVESHIGGYSDYLAAKTAEKNGGTAKGVKLSGVKEESVVVAQAPTPAAPRPAPKMTFKLKHELETLPAKIGTLEAEIAALKDRLADATLYGRDPEGFDKAALRLNEAEQELEQAEERWLELSAGVG